MIAVLGFELLRPALAWLLLAAPLVLVAGWVGLSRARAELALWVVERRRARFLPGAAPGRARARVVLGALAVLFLGAAALGPVRGHTYRAVSRKGLDLVVCLDTSRSMLAQDLRPSRLERAKREILGLLDHLTGDRVALVAFSGDARDVAPLTRDRGTLAGLLAHVTPDDNQQGGTDLAAAVAHALALFDGRTGAHEAIVLLTDGEDLEGKAAEQAEEARKRGIRVFVVGLGTEAGGKIPVVDAGGRPGFLVDDEGNEVVTRMHRESLANLAAVTGGDFLAAEESPTALEDLYRARVARIQGREIEGGERRVPYDRFQWPLALALACALVAEALRVRRAPRPRGGEARLAAAFLPLLALGGDEPRVPEHALAEAARHHAAGELAEAEAAARAVLAHADALELADFDRARAHYALGIVAATRALAEPEAGAEARDQARAELSSARALAGPGALRNDATYDLGTLELLEAERVRATIPEVSGQPPAPPAAPGGGIPGVPAEAPDPLKEARALYEAARSWLVERLRLDWRDEDTRANLELVQRRLRELEEIERQREEQEQQQQDPQQEDQDKQDQQQDSEQDSQQDQDGKESKDSKDSKDPGDSKDPQDSPKDPSSEDQDRESPPEDQAPPDEREPEPSDESKEPPPDAPEPGEGETQEPKGAQPMQPEERVLTREQVMQLLDKLAELEAKQKALDAALRARRRAKTTRDW